MREFEPVECPQCRRHVDPEEYDEVDEICDHCRPERETARGLKEMLAWPDRDILETSAAALAEMDPKDLPWGGSGMDDSVEQPGGDASV